jgi:hypothetical protein
MEIWAVVVIIIGVLSAIGWTVVIKKSKDLFRNALELKTDYEQAVADGTITDDEKGKMVEHLILIIEDATVIYQMLANAVYKIIGLIGFKKK